MLRTTLLLGALTGLLMAFGQALAVSRGNHCSYFCHHYELWGVLVLGQDRPQDVQRSRSD